MPGVECGLLRLDIIWAKRKKLGSDTEEGGDSSGNGKQRKDGEVEVKQEK